MTSESHAAMAAEIAELKAKLAEVKAERDNAQAFYEGQSDRSADLQEVLHKRTVERDKLEAACAALREALLAIKRRILFIGMPQEAMWADPAGGPRNIPDWRKQIDMLESALANAAGAKALDVLEAADEWERTLEAVIWPGYPADGNERALAIEGLRKAVRAKRGEQ